MVIKLSLSKDKITDFCTLMIDFCKPGQTEWFALPLFTIIYNYNKHLCTYVRICVFTTYVCSLKCSVNVVLKFMILCTYVEDKWKQVHN